MRLAPPALLALILVPGAATAQWSAPEVAELFGGTTWGPSEQFAQALDFDAGTLVAGAPALDHPSGTNAVGYAHVLELNGEGLWKQVQLIGASDFAAFDAFGSSVALDGDTLVAGAPFKGPEGAAYVFTRAPGSGGGFAEVAKLTPASGAFGVFGDAVALDGDTLVVGDRAWSSNAGRALVFGRDQGGPGAWGQVTALGSFFGTGSQFGDGVAVCGDTIAVSAPGREEVRVFERDQGGTGAWGEVAALSPGNLAPSGSFGGGLALDGDTLAVSGRLVATAAGKVFVFERDHGGPGAWGEVTSFQGSGLPKGAVFGASLALDGDLLVAGTPGSLFSTDVGTAHVFHRNQGGAGAWGEVARLDPGDGAATDQFGVGVAVQGGAVWAGAPQHDEAGPDAGAVYRYETSHTPERYCTAGTSALGCAAQIGTSGTPSASASSGFDLTASAVEGLRNGLFFFGSSGRQANPWGNGASLQCVVPPVSRGAPLIGAGTAGACDGSFAYDLNAAWCPSCPKAGHNPGPGLLVQAQLWYRDPLSTSNQPTSLSDAVEFLVQP